MHTFRVEFRSFEDVRDFVVLASTQPFDLSVCSGSHCVDGKSIMVMLSLDYSHPLQVNISCDQESCLQFLEETARFRVS